MKFLKSMLSRSEGLRACEGCRELSILFTVITEFTLVMRESPPLRPVLRDAWGSEEEEMVLPDSSVGVNICWSSLIVGIRSPVFSPTKDWRCTMLLGDASLDTPLVMMIRLGALSVTVTVLELGSALEVRNTLFKMADGSKDRVVEPGIESKELS